MDYKYIEQLLERYWQCLTTLEEERILRAFFQQEDIPAHLLQWKEWFSYPAEALNETTLDEDFDTRIMALVNEPLTVKARTVSIRQRLRPLLKATAIVAIVITLGNAIQYAINHPNNNPPTDIPTTPNGQTMASNDSIAIDTTKMQIPFSELRMESNDNTPTTY